MLLPLLVHPLELLLVGFVLYVKLMSQSRDLAFEGGRYLNVAPIAVALPPAAYTGPGFLFSNIPLLLPINAIVFLELLPRVGYAIFGDPALSLQIYLGLLL